MKEKGEAEESVWFIMSAYQYAHSAIFLYVFQSAASSSDAGSIIIINPIRTRGKRQGIVTELWHIINRAEIREVIVDVPRTLAWLSTPATQGNRATRQRITERGRHQSQPQIGSPSSARELQHKAKQQS